MVAMSAVDEVYFLSTHPIKMRGRPPSIRDEEILDAARDVFRAEGHATTTAKIAKRARVSEGILFYRYQSKEALLAAVIRRETQPPEALREVVKNASRRSIPENVERITETVLESVCRAHPFLELAITSRTSGEVHNLLFAPGTKPPPQQIVELLKDYFEDEIRLGRARAIDADAVARAIFGACIDYVRSGHGADDVETRRAFVRGLVDVLVHGTLKTASSRRQR
jgi:AcrR family transcriptional regulator